MNTEQAIHEYINGKCEAVEGWFHRLDMLLFCLLNAVQASGGITGDLCEVGVYKGKSLALMALFTRSHEKLFGFDAYPHDWMELTQRSIADVCPETTDIEYIRTDTTSLSHDRLGQLLPHKLRFLHIDAGHEYHEVLHTMCLFSPFLAADGIMVMDDYHDHEYPGVAAATLDFCLQPNPRQLVPFLAGANKMYLASPSLAERCQLALLRHPALIDTMRLSRIRDQIVLVAASREPMPSQVIADMIASDCVALSRDDNVATLASKAAKNAHAHLLARSTRTAE